MTTPDPKETAYRLAEVADLKMQVRALEAELAQSQAEVEKLQGQLKHSDALIEVLRRDRDGFGAVANSERELADELALALELHSYQARADGLARYQQARSGAQGEDS